MPLEVHPQFVVDDKGQTRSVLLSVEEFDALMDQIEDLEDAMLVGQLRETQKPEDFVPWEEVKLRLQAAGKIK